MLRGHTSRCARDERGTFSVLQFSCFAVSQCLKNVIFKETFLLPLLCVWPCGVPPRSYVPELGGRAVAEDWSASMETARG